MFLEELRRYYQNHDTHQTAELSILEEVLPTYFPDKPVHPAIQALSYGETPLPVGVTLLEWAGLKRWESFLDLGCGCGALVLLAASQCQRAAGVDLSPAAIQFAKAAGLALGVGNADFAEQDLLEAELGAFDVLYCCSTAVSQWLADQLGARLGSCRAGTRVVTVTHPLRAGGIRTIEQRSLRFSWHNDRNVKTWDFYLHQL
ncbi:class I SAM-dependent methyltransferase [bacterium]|nr:class I SAM-dependent methyltransferase [bacterium]